MKGDTMNGECSNPNGCPNQASDVSSMCHACASYWHQAGHERPRRLCLWPRHGHPLPVSLDVCTMTGLTYRQVNYLVSRGLVTPTVPGDGSGTSCGWTVDDVARLVAVHAARKAGDTTANDGAIPGRVTFGPGVAVEVDLATIRDRLLALWPPGAPTDLSVEEANIIGVSPNPIRVDNAA